MVVSFSDRFRKLARRSLVSALLLTIVLGLLSHWLMFVRITNGELSFQNSLLIPPEMMGEEVENKFVYSLVVDEGNREFVPSRKTQTAGVNGDYLGPTLRLRRNQQVAIQVDNRLDEETTMHWHGMHVPADMDGTPHQVIEPGKQWTASFEVDQQASTLWYHPHPHGETGRQSYRGIAGLLLIDDEFSDALDIPRAYGIDDIPLIIQDRRFDEDGQLEFTLNQGAVYGDEILVNGTWDPFLSIESRLIRFRLLNGSNARIFHLGFDDDRTFHQIATDGGFLDKPVAIRRLVLAPGERAEILVDFSDGKEALLKSFPEAGWLQTAEGWLDGIGSGHFHLLKIKPTEPHVASHAVPETLRAITRMQESDATRSRPMVLGGFVARNQANRPAGARRGPIGPPINGKIMDMHRIDEVVQKGQTEIWEIRNQTGQPHPFHVHLVQFQILDRNGAAPLGAERGWKDTVLVHPGDQVRIIMNFSRYADPQTPYMYHCHIMEHEDRGMMGQFLVVDEPESLESTQGKPTVVVFVAAFQCEHCFEQVQLFDRRLQEAGLNFLIVTPEASPDPKLTGKVTATVVSDPGKRWAGWLGLMHDGPAHGTYLLDSEGRVVWGDDSDVPFMDVDLVLEMHREWTETGSVRLRDRDRRGRFPSPSETR